MTIDQLLQYVPVQLVPCRCSAKFTSFLCICSALTQTKDLVSEDEVKVHATGDIEEGEISSDEEGEIKGEEQGGGG